MARTPRNFDGITPTGKKASDLLGQVLKKMGAPSAAGSAEIFLFWKEAIGEAMAPFTEPVSFVDGVFIVTVKSATLYSLLCTHEQSRLLKKLQEKFQVRKLLFRMG